MEPPDLSGAEVGVELAEVEPPPPDDELLHAAAVTTIAAAPARQAVRIDRSRKLTGIHLLVIDRTLVGDKHRVDRPAICLGYSHPPGVPARTINRGPPVRDNACIRPTPARPAVVPIPQNPTFRPIAARPGQNRAGRHPAPPCAARRPGYKAAEAGEGENVADDEHTGPPAGAPRPADTPAPGPGPGGRHHGPLRSLAGDHAYGPLYGQLLLLTVLTGVVDAVSILSLGRVFVANMTGNVVFAAFAVVGAPGFSLSASLFALAGFLVGAYAGGTLITRLSSDRGLLLRAGVLAELVLVAVALTVAAVSGDPGARHGTLGMTGGAFSAAVTDATAALLAMALGVQNAVARGLAVPDMTTTVLTMTLTGVGADLRALYGHEAHVHGASR